VRACAYCTTTSAGEGGIKFLLDLAEVTGLRDGDGLVLDDGTAVAVIANAQTSALQNQALAAIRRPENRENRIQLVKSG
jgi:urease accessory protein UreE